MKKLEYQFSKTINGWAVSGKKTPCSSREKVFVYLWREFCKQFPNSTKARVIFEVEDGS